MNLTAKKQANTSGQNIASDPAYSIWVSASAGTGKTKVLTDRVLRLLLNGTKPSKILCITYTKAAAAEMSNRINSALQRWVIAEETALIKELSDLTGVHPSPQIIMSARSLFAKVIDSADSLHIHTIHSFCTHLLKRFPLEADINPFFSVMEEQTTNEMVNEAYRRLLTESQKDKDIKKAFDYLAANVTDSSIRKIVSIIISNRLKIKTLLESGTNDKIKDKIYAVLDLQRGKSADEYREQAFTGADRESITKLARSMMENGNENDQSRSVVLSDWLSGTGNFNEYAEIFTKKNDNKPKKPGSVATKSVRESLPDAEEIITAEQERLSNIIDKIKAVSIATTTESILDISASLILIYESLKRFASVLDYDDLIYFSYRLLSDKEKAPWVMYKLDGGIDYLLLDEAQDTSPQQWKIIQALCDEFFAGIGSSTTARRVFVVGDEKQSIFSFQGADPEEFNRMHDYFAGKSEAAKHNWRTVLLNTSFRSTEAVLKMVDEVFSDKSLAKSISTQEEKINHDVHRLDAPGKVELWDLIETKKFDDGKEWRMPIEVIERENSKDQLAEKVVATVNGWFKQGKCIKTKDGRIRQLTPGDIMILVYHRDELPGLLIRKFKAADIRVAGIDRLKLQEYIAIMDLVALGNFILLPEDDLNLATLLKTPLINLDEESLFNLAYNRKGSLWESLKEKANNDKKLSAAHAFLSSLLEQTKHLSPFELYNHVLDVKDGRKKFISRLGEEVKDPFNEFLNMCLQYEQQHSPSLQGFISWFSSDTKEIKRSMDQNDDAVNIMTVHASKGLQAPIVFLVDTTRLRGPDTQILWNDDGIFLAPLSTENFDSTCEKINKQEKAHVFDEYIRLLYVAMTRAQDELYICGTAGINKINDNCWYRIVERTISKIGKKTGNGWEVVSGKMLENIPVEDKKAADTTLPDYLLNSVTQESGEQTYYPSGKINSNLALADTKSITRGNAIHKLLEILPAIEKEKNKEVGKKILERQFPELENKDNLLDNVVNVINDPEFSDLFGDNSRAEIEVCGKIEGKHFSGRIDRLVVRESEVLIIDYKSTTVPPENAGQIPQEYIEQMKAYKKILQDVYRDKKIRAFLLWTANLELMEVY